MGVGLRDNGTNAGSAVGATAKAVTTTDNGVVGLGLIGVDKGDGVGSGGEAIKGEGA